MEEAGEIAECFSEYFAGVASNLDASIPLTDVSPLSRMNKNVLSSIFLRPTTPKEISDIILNLKKYVNGRK